MLKSLEQNVRAVEKDIRSLCYYSQGSVTYDNALIMSPYERNEWIRYINEINAEQTNKFRQDVVPE